MGDRIIEITTTLQSHEITSIFRDTMTQIFNSWNALRRAGRRLDFEPLTVGRGVFNNIDGVNEPAFAAVATFTSKRPELLLAHVQFVVYDRQDVRRLLIKPISPQMMSGSVRKNFIEPLTAALLRADPRLREW